MPEATPVSVAGMNALQLPAFFENLGHSNVILSGGFGHRDGPKAGAISCRQGEEVWKAWKAGQYGNISLNEAVIEFAKTHEELKGAFLTFQKDADEIYPGWREQLTDQSVQATDTASWFWSIFSGLCCMGRGRLVASLFYPRPEFPSPAVPIHLLSVLRRCLVLSSCEGFG